MPARPVVEPDLPPLPAQSLTLQRSLSQLPPPEALPPLPPPPEVLAPWLFFPPKLAQTTWVTPPQPAPSPPPAQTPSPPAAASGPPGGEQASPQPPSPPPPLPDAAAKGLDKSGSDNGGPTAPLPQSKLPVHGFDDSTIRMLNARLEDPDWQKRADAANDFYLVLETNPSLADRPEYKPYVDAFALKILQDPISVVHEPVIRAIQLGLFKHPNDEIMGELTNLEDASGLLGLEPQMIDDALRGLADEQTKEAQKAARKNPAAASIEPTLPDSAPPVPQQPQAPVTPTLPVMTSNPLPELSTPPLAASAPLSLGPRASKPNRWPWPFHRKGKEAIDPASLPRVSEQTLSAMGLPPQYAGPANPEATAMPGGQLNVLAQ